MHIDFNDENGFAAAKEKLRQLGDKFSSIEPIKKYGKSVAETLNNHYDSAKLFKNRQAKSSIRYPKLSLEMKNGINQYLQSSPETIIVDKYDIQIRKKDVNALWTLSGNCEAWLNENITYFYLNIIVSQTTEILCAYNIRFLAEYLDEGNNQSFFQ